MRALAWLAAYASAFAACAAMAVAKLLGGSPWAVAWALAAIGAHHMASLWWRKLRLTNAREARRQALEEAAGICEAVNSEHGEHPEMALTCRDAIRSAASR